MHTLGNEAAAAPQFHEEDAEYVFARTLAQNDTFDDLRITLDKDSEFELTHVKGVWAQNFAFNIQTPRGKPLASSLVQAANFFGTGQFPRPFLRSMVYAPGAQLHFSIQNLFAGNNAVELIFCGIRRYRTQ